MSALDVLSNKMPSMAAKKSFLGATLKAEMDLQLPNAEFPMEVTLSGMKIDLRESQ